MRMRNPKNMETILKSCDYFLDDNLFNNNNDINLEIGMGKGNFIINMAINNPDKNYIGIEKYSSVISHAIKKINEYKENGYKLDNLKLLNIDVKNIPVYLNNKINTIYLNFSDPWPKKRNAKRRLTHENFFERVWCGYKITEDEYNYLLDLSIGISYPKNDVVKEYLKKSSIKRLILDYKKK